jgi:hypothetical protein
MIIRIALNNKDAINEYMESLTPNSIVFTDTEAVVYTDDDLPTEGKPVIKLTADKAKIMLFRIGILPIIESIITSLGGEAKLAYDNAPEMYSDNLLVTAVLRSPPLSKTDAEIYQLFVDASHITY